MKALVSVHPPSASFIFSDPFLFPSTWPHGSALPLVIADVIGNPRPRIDTAAAAANSQVYAPPCEFLINNET